MRKRTIGSGEGVKIVDEFRRQSALRVCDYYRRGIYTANEACRRVLLSCAEPAFVAEYVTLLPAELQATLLALLPTLPASDDD
jgi:hypothetical protein